MCPKIIIKEHLPNLLGLVMLGAEVGAVKLGHRPMVK